MAVRKVELRWSDHNALRYTQNLWRRVLADMSASFFRTIGNRPLSFDP